MGVGYTYLCGQSLRWTISLLFAISNPLKPQRVLQGRSSKEIPIGQGVALLSRKYAIHAAMLVAILVLASSPANARKVTLSTSDLKCIVNNIDVYLAAPNDPLLIIPGECPNPNIDAHNGPVPSKQATVAVLKKSELRCLADGFRRLSSDRLQRKKITWDLSRCRK